ncbi:Histone-lysine N-methyltransferase, H3 lysine-36 and H4 lysine-20 specific [Echinococcus granulosus]|uniref:Histone-lysine N-methyltransferase, H3 lysine-36 and H4 lysine-20 specific n=1 Tax=Echinococcus granulosus TaxID=6210 RepID=W6UVD4_ECHGR|nr:Histone-lysine N-methyltransferase, H3 lysine-36 and H4 lysine-20 specific [Echinococcus granulosus]EUB64586.1 Histone-lysine N-methyltransferase, H3 lysine-36 and H4 lysine-20 specific [Echinococcus granulosus]
MVRCLYLAATRMEYDQSDFSLGRMYWAKVATYPWWPCMIYNSPDGDGYAKHLKTTSKYHVQFFGPTAERAWINETNLIPYDSKCKLESQLAKLRKSQGSKYELKVPNSQRNKWEESCREAKAACQLPLEERIRLFDRIVNPPKTSSAAPELEGKLFSFTLRSAMLLKNVERIPLTIEEEAESLDTFLKTEKARRLELNPNISEAELDRVLRIQWSGFDFATQRSYLSKKLAIFGLESTADVDEEMRERATGRRSSASGSVSSSARKSVSSAGSKAERSRRRVAEGGSKVDAEILRLIASPGPYRFQPVCFVCTETSNDRSVLLKCRGYCGRYWHPGCLPDSTASDREIGNPTKFTCNDCQNKKYLCNVCGAAKESEATGEEMCPRVFHAGDLCTPAGSRELSLSHIICPAHLKPTKRVPAAPFCLACRDGGSDRVNCEFCPTSYHRTCLGNTRSEQKIIKQNIFNCNNCRWGVQPRYAQVVWVKVHSCRWWPCEIIHSRNAPLNIYSLKHSDGEFVIHFIGSNEYGWVHRCQTLPFECALGSLLAVDVSNAIVPLDKAFNRALCEAPQVHRLYVSYLLKRGLSLVSMMTEVLTDEQLIPLSTLEAAAAVGILSHSETEAKALDEAMVKFESVSSNVYASSDEEMLAKHTLPTTPCECARKLEEEEDQQNSRRGGHREVEARVHWRCSVDTNCRNILGGIECSPKVCSVMARDPSGNCGNRNFSNPPAVSLLLTTNRGVGLKVVHPVAKGALVIEYVGEVINIAEANRRLAKGIAACNAAAATAHNSELLPSTHLLRFTSALVIDASQVGNEARFVNHSCEPNAMSRVYNVDGTLRLGFFATRYLEEQEEVTIDYREAQLLDCYFMNAINVCVCGSEACDGFVRLPHKFLSTEKKRKGRLSAALAMPKPQSSVSERSLRSGRLSEMLRRPETMGPPPPPQRSLTERSMPPPSEPPVRSLEPNLPPGSRSSSSNTIPHHLLSAAATEKPAPATVTPATPTHCTPKVVVTQRLTQPLHEEYCFRCGDGGEMIVCNRASCPRVYHLGCLGLSTPPRGDWHCPWHFCDICGNPSLQMCCRCPNSYCLDHTSTKDGKELIRVHELDASRWLRTLKVLERCSSDPVQMTKMTAALIFRCRWVCHVHDQARPRLPGSTTTLKGSGVAETTATTETEESSVIHETANGRVGSDDGEVAAGYDSPDDSVDESPNDFATLDREEDVNGTPEDEDVDDKLGNDDDGEDNTSTIYEDAEQVVEGSSKRGSVSPCEAAGECFDASTGWPPELGGNPSPGGCGCYLNAQFG